jgi:hypothetical protein
MILTDWIADRLGFDKATRRRPSHSSSAGNASDFFEIYILDSLAFCLASRWVAERTVSVAPSVTSRVFKVSSLLSLSRFAGIVRTD